MPHLRELTRPGAGVVDLSAKYEEGLPVDEQRVAATPLNDPGSVGGRGINASEEYNGKYCNGS